MLDCGGAEYFCRYQSRERASIFLFRRLVSRATRIRGERRAVGPASPLGRFCRSYWLMVSAIRSKGFAPWGRIFIARAMTPFTCARAPALRARARACMHHPRKSVNQTSLTRCYWCLVATGTAVLASCKQALAIFDLAHSSRLMNRDSYICENAHNHIRARFHHFESRASADGGCI